MSGTFRLPPLAGAVLLQALRAAAGLLDPRPHRDEDHHPNADEAHADVPAGTPAGREPAAAAGAGLGEVTSSNLADALVVIAETFLAAKITAAPDPEIYQVIVHVGTDALLPDTPDTPDTRQPGVPAETPPAAPGTPGHPAGPGRCHVQDGPAISVSTAQMTGCTAALTWLLHDRDGTALDAGRKRRYATTAQRRAARDRDKCRCRFPGCESRRVDLHHIRYWANGGPTSLDNLLSLCPRHHALVHDRGYLIAARPGGAFAFYHPGGTPLPDCRPCPTPAGTSGTGTTPTSPPTPSSPCGTANASTWTTPSTPASPTPNTRKTKPASSTTCRNPHSPDTGQATAHDVSEDRRCSVPAGDAPPERA